MKSINNAEKMANLWHIIVQNNKFNICAEKLKGVTILDVNILRIVEETPEIILRKIGDKLGVSSSTLSSAVKRLENKGLIERVISKQDLRSYGLILTEEGDKAIKEHYRKEVELMNNLLSRFDNEEEKDMFIMLFDKMIGSFGMK